MDKDLPISVCMKEAKSPNEVLSNTKTGLTIVSSD
jgi:hypothetical protein